MPKLIVIFDVPALMIEQVKNGSHQVNLKGDTLMHTIIVDTDQKHTLLDMCVVSSDKQQHTDEKRLAKKH